MNLVWKKSSFFKYILPIAIVYTIFTFVPIAVSLYYSLTNFSGFGAYEFVGFKNFATAITDKFLWRAFGNTFLYAVITLVTVVPLSFLMALAIQKKSKKTAIYRTIYFLPYTLGGAIVALIWNFKHGSERDRNRYDQSVMDRGRQPFANIIFTDYYLGTVRILHDAVVKRSKTTSRGYYRSFCNRWRNQTPADIQSNSA